MLLGRSPVRDSPRAARSCTSSKAINFDPEANFDDGTFCIFFTFIPGCISPWAANFNPKATVDDGTCIPKVEGCMDSTSPAFDKSANAVCSAEAESWEACPCVYGGCDDPTAKDYVRRSNVRNIQKFLGFMPNIPNAEVVPLIHPDTCTFYRFGCMDSKSKNDYDPLAERGAAHLPPRNRP